MPWSDTPEDPFTIPAGAGPGQARIVIGSQLPPPLDTYVPDGVYSFATGLSGAVIIYSQGDDEQYVFIAGVEDGAGPEIGGLIIGFVSGGVVMEYTPGTPLAVMWKQLGVANTAEIITRANAINMLAAQNVLIGADDTITVSALTLASLLGAALELTAHTGDLEAVATLGDVIVSAGGDVSIAGGEVLLDGTDVIVDGALHWRTGGGADAITVENTDNVGMSGTNVAYSPNMTGGVAGATLGVAFTAAASRRAVVLLRAGIDNTTAAGVGYAGYTLRTGSVVGAGAVVQAAADAIAIQHEGTAASRQSLWDVVTGLTAGDPYNVVMEHRSSAIGNTAAFADRAIAVLPAL